MNERSTVAETTHSDPAREGRTRPWAAAPGLRPLWQRRWSILTVAALAAAGSIFYAEQRGTVWRARTSLYVERDLPILPGQEVSLWLQSRNYANTQAGLLRSTPIVQEALRRIGESPLFDDTDNPIVWLQRRLKVSVGEQDDLITVTLDSPHIESACAVVNALVASYVDFHSDSHRETASAVLQDLDGELRRQEQQLEQIQKEQLEFLRAHPGMTRDAEWSAVATERLRELRTALHATDLTTMDLRIELQSARDVLTNPERTLHGSGSMDWLEVEDPARDLLHTAQQARLRLLQVVTQEHPQVQELDASIAALRNESVAATRAAVSARIAAIEYRLNIAKTRSEDLRNQIAQQEQQMLAAGPAQAEYRAIERRYERTRRIADLLHDRLRSLDINERLDAERKVDLNIMVYDRAEPASSVVASSKRSLVAVLTFCGLLAGLCIAWLRAMTDQRLRHPDDLRSAVALLGAVPKVGRVRDVVRFWHRRPDFAAAMRALRAVLHYGFCGDHSRVLQVTSPRSTGTDAVISAGLAMAMAHAGEKTLVIDADVRADRQADLLEGNEKSEGLGAVLQGAVSIRASIVPTAVPGLHLLPARAARNGEVIEGGSMSRILDAVAAEFDRILIASPPLLDDADARILAAVCDATVLVVTAGRTDRKALHSSLDLIAAVGGRTAGAVLVGTNEIAATPDLTRALDHVELPLTAARARTSRSGRSAAPTASVQ
jgi:succinoglycan biosynthesis transport protein ExoP